MTVNTETMQHDKFDNVFALGDCSNLPTSKTAAAIAAQNVIVAKNVEAVLTGQQLDASYQGYTRFFFAYFITLVFYCSLKVAHW